MSRNRGNERIRGRKTMYVNLCPMYIHVLEPEGPRSFLHLQSVVATQVILYQTCSWRRPEPPRKFSLQGQARQCSFRWQPLSQCWCSCMCVKVTAFPIAPCFKLKVISTSKGKCKRAAYILSSQRIPACVRTIMYCSINHLVYQSAFSSSNSPQFTKPPIHQAEVSVRMLLLSR